MTDAYLNLKNRKSKISNQKHKAVLSKNKNKN